VIKGEMAEIAGDALERRVAASLAPALGAQAPVTVRDDDRVHAWRRIVVGEGIELNVRDDSPAARDETLMAMREAIRAALGREDVR
jgi:hypothetical protein